MTADNVEFGRPGWRVVTDRDANGNHVLQVGGGAEAGPADNTAFTDGTTPVTPAGFVYDDVGGTALTENDAAAARIDSKRAQMVVLEDGTTRGRVAKVLTTLEPTSSDNGLVVAQKPYSYGWGPTTFTRTADTNAYAAGDIVGSATGSTAALSFIQMGATAQRILITSAALMIDKVGVISGETTYTLHLYSITPPSALGDNVAFNLPSGDRDSYLGSIDLGTPVDRGDTLYVETHNINKQVKLAGTGMWGYLVTVGAHTPESATNHRIYLNTVGV